MLTKIIVPVLLKAKIFLTTDAIFIYDFRNVLVVPLLLSLSEKMIEGQ